MTTTNNNIIKASGPNDLDYKEINKIVDGLTGFMRISSKEGTSIEIFHSEEGGSITEYQISGEALIDFLLALKDKHVDQLFATIDFCEYVKKSAHQPPSVFVRDAIVTKANDLYELIRKTN